MSNENLEVQSSETDLPEIHDSEPVSDNQNNDDSDTREKENLETPDTPSDETNELGKIDPNKLPPELQKLYKGMQADYTRKQQQLAKAIEGLEPHKEKLALIDKALTGDPEAMQKLSRITQSLPNQQQQQQTYDFNKIPETFESPKHLTDFFDQRMTAAFNNFLGYLNQNVIGKMQQPIAEMQNQVLQEKVAAEIQSARAKYSDFQNKEKEIAKVVQKYPGISLDDAYKLVSFSPKVPAQKIVSKPGVNSRAVTHKPSSESMTWEDAFKLAKEQI